MPKLCVHDTNIALVWTEMKWICCLLTDTTIGGLTSSSVMLPIFTKLTCTYKYITYSSPYTFFYVQMDICTYITCDINLQITVHIFPTYPYIFAHMNLHYTRCWYCCFLKFCFQTVFLQLFLLLACDNMHTICICTPRLHVVGSYLLKWIFFSSLFLLLQSVKFIM